MARTVRPTPVNVDGEGRPVLDDRRQIDELQAWHKATPAVLPGNKLTSPKTDRQSYALGVGEYKPTQAKSTVRVDTIGVGSATLITPNVAINTPFAFYQGARFNGVITVPATSVLMLVGCIVTKEVSVAAGGRIHAVCCHFEGIGYINNAGVATASHATDCHNTSSVIHVNTTISGSTS